MVAVPVFETTPLDAIAPTVKKVHDAFDSQITKPLEFRMQQLRKLYWACVVHSAWKRLASG